MKLKFTFALLYTLMLFLLIGAMAFAQSKSSGDDGFLAFATVMPELQGGIGELTKKINYPTIAKQSGLEGKVFAMAFVDEQGNVGKVKIIKGLGGGCDEEVIRVLSSSKFKPGLLEGKPVKVKTTISVVFKLK